MNPTLSPEANKAKEDARIRALAYATRNGTPITAAKQADSNLDEQRLAERIKELTAPNLVRPALIDPAEVDTARAKFKTPNGLLNALNVMADIRLAWLNQRDGMKTSITLTPAQKESAMQFFTTHPDQPPVEESHQPDQWEIVRGITPPQAPPPAPATPPAKPAPDSNYAIMSLLAAQGRLLARIADTLDVIASNTAPAAPNYHRPLSGFADFDWATIGAVVAARDGDGVSAVECNGYDYTRRAGGGKYGQAVWFSRATGKDADGNNTYARLITFKDRAEAEPLPSARK